MRKGKKVYSSILFGVVGSLGILLVCNYSGWSAGKIGVSIKTSLRASRTGIPCLRRVEI
jgi:hypothetical protein